LNARSDRFLTNIKVAKAANEPEAVKLARFFLKSPNEKHFSIKVQKLIPAGPMAFWLSGFGELLGRRFLCCCLGQE
jgi:hypothetical protein